MVLGIFSVRARTSSNPCARWTIPVLVAERDTSGMASTVESEACYEFPYS